MFPLLMLFASKSSFERLRHGRGERENKRLIFSPNTYTAGSERDPVQAAHHNSSERTDSVHIGAKGKIDVLKRVCIATALKKT